MTDAFAELAALPKGTQLEKYELLGVLGQGGGGITYLALDTQLQREVAIKEHGPLGLCTRTEGTAEIVVHNEAAYAHSLQSFCRGARLLAGLHHVGMARVHEIFCACGTAFLVMDYVKGASLLEWMRERPSASRIRQLLSSLLSALAYLHSHGVIHRDIKPGNILIQAGDAPVLIDFDASMPEAPTHTPTPVGTPGYAAPEQFEQGSLTDPRADIYALARSFVAVSEKCGVTLPWRLGRTVQKACAENPSRRYQSAAEWQHALRGHRPWWGILIFLLGGLVALAASVCPLSEAPSPSSCAPARPVKKIRVTKPWELVEVGKDFRMKKGYIESPELEEEIALQHAVLSAQAEHDMACEQIRNTELLCGKITAYQFNRKCYDLEEQLNKRIFNIINTYIADYFDGIDPEPRRTLSIRKILEINKMRFYASLSRDYPLPPDHVVLYDRSGKIVKPRTVDLTKQELELLHSLLAMQHEFEQIDSPSVEQRELFNLKVADAVSAYLVENFDENYSFAFKFKPLVKRILKQGLPPASSRRLINSYPYVLDVGNNKVHRELNGEKRLLQIKVP